MKYMGLWYEALVASVCGLNGVAKQITSIILNPTVDHYACVRISRGFNETMLAASFWHSIIIPLQFTYLRSTAVADPTPSSRKNLDSYIFTR